MRGTPATGRKRGAAMAVTISGFPSTTGTINPRARRIDGKPQVERRPFATLARVRLDIDNAAGKRLPAAAGAPAY